MDININDLQPCDLVTLIQTRRTIHKFKPDAVDERIIHAALDLFRWIPDHHLLQSWLCKVVGEKTKKQLLALALAEFSKKNADTAVMKAARWADIPHWVMVTQNIENKTALQIKEEYGAISTGLYAMMLFLHQNNIGSKWSTGSIIFTEDWCKCCGIDLSKEAVVGLFWLGYAEETPRVVLRKTAENYVSYLA